MVHGVEGAVFGLPSEILKDEENFNKNSESESEYCFPAEFPYDFAASFSPVAASSRTRAESYEDDLLAGLTRQFTLSSLGPVHRPSPHANLTQSHLSGRSTGGLCNACRNRPSQFEPPVLQNTHEMIRGQHAMEQQNVGCGMWYSPPQQVYQNRSGRPAAESAWTIHRNAQMRPVFLGGGVKGGGCAGTGVFLPRIYGNNNYSNAYGSNSGKKTGLLPVVVPNQAALAFHKNFDGMNSVSQSQPRPRFSSGIIPNYDTSMARKNELLMQHRRSLLPEGLITQDIIYLPQEWTY